MMATLRWVSFSWILLPLTYVLYVMNDSSEMSSSRMSQLGNTWFIMTPKIEPISVVGSMIAATA